MKASILALTVVAMLGSAAPRIALGQANLPSTLQDLKIKTDQILAKDTLTVSFAPGSSELTESERNNLSAAITAVKNSATISSAVVAGWADRQYPEVKDQVLEKSERKLAETRVTNVKNALIDFGVTKVETHSMAEHPTWLGKLLNTKDTMLKGEGKIKSEKDEQTAMIGKILRENGGPSKVVVVIRRQGSQAAH